MLHKQRRQQTTQQINRMSFELAKRARIQVKHVFLRMQRRVMTHDHIYGSFVFHSVRVK